MRRAFAAVILMLVFSAGLFPAVGYEVPVGFEQRILLDRMFDHAIAGRKDCDIRVTGFSESDGTLVLSFLLDGGEYSISAPDLDALGRFLDNALFLEERLYLSDNCISYVDGNIIAASGDMTYGGLYYAIDADGRKKALLGFDRVNGNGVALFRPVWISELVPGYSLVKGPSWALDVSGTSTLRDDGFSVSFSLKQISWMRNFRPAVSFGLFNTGRGMCWMFGLGAETRASLSGLFDTGFSMIEDGAVYAGASLLLGFGNGFEWGADYCFGYEQVLWGRMYYRIGYQGSSLLAPSLGVSLGVMF